MKPKWQQVKNLFCIKWLKNSFKKFTGYSEKTYGENSYLISFMDSLLWIFYSSNYQETQLHQILISKSISKEELLFHYRFYYLYWYLTPPMNLMYIPWCIFKLFITKSIPSSRKLPEDNGLSVLSLKFVKCQHFQKSTLRSKETVEKINFSLEVKY